MNWSNLYETSFNKIDQADATIISLNASFDSLNAMKLLKTPSTAKSTFEEG